MTAALYLRLPPEPAAPGPARPAMVVTDLRPAAGGAADRRAHQARAAEVAGFAGVVVPFDPDGDDPLVAAAALAAVTRRIRVFAGVPTSLAGPVYLAKLAVTFQRFSGDRLGWWVATGPDGAGAGRPFGDPLTGAAALERDAELLTVARRVFAGESVDHAGAHFSVVGGGFAPPLAGRPFPPVAVAGPADVAADLAAAHGDHLVLTSTDPATVGSQVAELRRRAAAAGRTVTPLAEVTVVARDDADDARAVAARRGDGDAGSPGGPVERLVGSYAEVADRLARLHDGGVDAFVLRLDPAVDETYRIGHHLRPLLEARTAEEADRVA